eukprot:Gb_30310 [translate_table: standard]
MLTHCSLTLLTTPHLLTAQFFPHCSTSLSSLALTAQFFLTAQLLLLLRNPAKKRGSSGSLGSARGCAPSALGAHPDWPPGAPGCGWAHPGRTGCTCRRTRPCTCTPGAGCAGVRAPGWPGA